MSCMKTRPRTRTSSTSTMPATTPTTEHKENPIEKMVDDPSLKKRLETETSCDSASSSSTETPHLHLPCISPAQCHMLHIAQQQRPHSPAKLPASCLPRLKLSEHRHHLLLDLDHTLINTHPFEPTTGVAGIDWLKLVLPRHTPTYVCLRPHLAEFVREVQRLPFDLSIFTASSEAVARPKLDWLESRLCKVDLSGCTPPVHHGGLFLRRFYQDACTRLQPPGSPRLLLIKDLRAVMQPGADLARVVLVEDLPVACAWQPSNVLPIEPWWGQSPST